MRRQRGQSTVEFAITFAAITLPMTVAIVYTAQLLWVWHGVVEFTRAGAQYAVTHCAQSAGANVITYMQSNVPPMIDSNQFQTGGATIDVQYFQRNEDTGQLETFACEGDVCVPDTVTVSVTGYEFRRVLTGFGVMPVPLPDFRTSLPMESAGYRPDSTECLE